MSVTVAVTHPLDPLTGGEIVTAVGVVRGTGDLERPVFSLVVLVDPPKDVGDFECMGTTSFEGKEYLTYRSVEKQADAGAATGAPMLHRTIYVDPKTGLPAANIVAGDTADSEVVFKGLYDYPEKLEIEDHPDAPLVKMR